MSAQPGTWRCLIDGCPEHGKDHNGTWNDYLQHQAGHQQQAQTSPTGRVYGKAE